MLLPFGDLFISVSTSLEWREWIHLMFSGRQSCLKCLESNLGEQLITGAF